jgi:hypothetical protein
MKGFAGDRARMTPGIAANVFGLAVVAGWLLRRAVPPSEAARLRNAFLIDEGKVEDFAWTPERVPPGFMLERQEPDPFFAEVAGRFGGKDDWERALAIASHLVETARELGPIRAGLRRTYQRIREGFGYCADHVRVYMAIAHAAGLPVRQWGFSFDGFGGRGHTLVEVFDRKRRKWLMIDVYNNVHAVDAATGEPLSALEYRAALRGERNAADLVLNGPGRPGFRIGDKAVDYYRNGLDGWYMIWGNAVQTYDAHPIVGPAAALSRTLSDLIASIAGVRPRMRVYANAANAGDLSRMRSLRGRLCAVAVVAALLGTTLIAQLAIGQDHGRN